MFAPLEFTHLQQIIIYIYAIVAARQLKPDIPSYDELKFTKKYFVIF